MGDESSYSKGRKIGSITTFAVFFLGIAYAVITFLGLLSLRTPLDPIGDPFFTLMEILTLLIAPAMAVSMVGIHFFASSEDKAYSLAGALFMFLMTGITSCVHFVILIFSYQLPADRLANLSSVLSFKWPSVAYALDILAWDWFYAISVLLAAQVFKHGKLERTTRMLMIVSGVLGLFGLVCVSLQKMQIRNIGIIGYAVIGPVSFLLISKILHGQQYTIGKKKA